MHNTHAHTHHPTAMNKVKRAAMVLAASELVSQEEVPELHALFHSLDADCSGYLTADELRVALARQGKHVTDVSRRVRLGGGGGGAGRGMRERALCPVRAPARSPARAPKLPSTPALPPPGRGGCDDQGR